MKRFLPQRRYLSAFFGTVLGLLFLFSGPGIFPQDKKARKEEASQGPPIYRVPVNVVVVNATVTDKSGNPVTDLTANDFKVYEDGKPQNIQTFALESYGPAESEEPKVPDTSPKRAPVERNATRPRMISLLIDDLTMASATDFPLMIESVKSFVKRDMGPLDQVAVLSGSERVQIPFTNDKQQLLEALSAALEKLNYSTLYRSTCPKLTDLQAWRIADGMRSMQDLYYKDAINETIQCYGLDSNNNPSAAATAETILRTAAMGQNQVSTYQTRNLLYLFRQHLRALKHFEGTRMIVFFSDGFLSESGSAEAYQTQELVDMALRSGIVINTVNIRGVPIMADAREQEDLDAQETPLSQMAYDTGGLFFHNQNNLYLGLQKVVRRQSYYYILTYGTPSQKADGAYHRIKLEVTRPGLELSYRKGYYTPKEQLSYESRNKEEILAALNAPGNMSEIPMTLAYNYSQEEDSSYSVSFVTNVNIRGMQFLDEDARRKNLVSLYLVAFDENDKYVNGLEKSIDFRLQESSYTSLRDHGLTSRVELKLPIGNYKIKAVVREGLQGKMGSITKSVEIP